MTHHSDEGYKALIQVLNIRLSKAQTPQETIVALYFFSVDYLFAFYQVSPLRDAFLISFGNSNALGGHNCPLSVILFSALIFFPKDPLFCPF